MLKCEWKRCLLKENKYIMLYVINLGSSFNSDFLTSYGSYDSTTLPAKWRPQALLAELPC